MAPNGHRKENGCVFRLEFLTNRKYSNRDCNILTLWKMGIMPYLVRHQPERQHY